MVISVIPREKVCLKAVALFTAVAFVWSAIVPPCSFAQNSRIQTVLGLPEPGAMVAVTPAYVPPMLRGMKVSREDPFAFDFILDTGHSQMDADGIAREADTLIKYFLTSLAIPEDDLWVNLSPYEKDRIIAAEFGATEMGRDLLAEDYLLKQLTASMIYPEKELGQEFWSRVYKRAKELYGTRDVPLDTFNKVWVVPDKAVVYQNKDAAYIVKSHLKVMLEEDYVALSYQEEAPGPRSPPSQDNVAADDRQGKDINKLGSQIVREVILPELEKEINEGRNFARLRQVYASLILAKWYKQNLKQSILNRAYSDRKKTGGIEVDDKTVTEKIYQQYIRAFQKGVFAYIREDYDADARQTIPRKYFSGGLRLRVPIEVETNPTVAAQVVPQGQWLEVRGNYVQSQRVSARFVNDFITGQFQAGEVNPGEAIVLSDGRQVPVYLVPGLLRTTGQFGHIGLGVKEEREGAVVYKEGGLPVVYLDADYAADQTLRANERFKVEKWEAQKVNLGDARRLGRAMTAAEMRLWIRKNMLEATALLRQWDNEAPSLDGLFQQAQEQGILPSDETIASTYASLNDLTDLNLAGARRGNGVPYVRWFEGLSNKSAFDIQRQVFGENVEGWLQRHNQTGDSAVMNATVARLLADEEFTGRIKTLARDDAALEILRFAISKNYYLGTRNLGLFLDNLRKEADEDLKKHLPTLWIPLRSYVQVVTGVGAIQEFLEGDQFRGLGREDRLVSIIAEIRRRGLDMESDNLRQVYSALPGQLSPSVKKESLQIVVLPMVTFDQMRAALANAEIQAYLQGDAFRRAGREKRLIALVREIHRRGLDLESRNLRQIYYALSGRDVHKSDIAVPSQKAELTPADLANGNGGAQANNAIRWYEGLDRQVPASAAGTIFGAGIDAWLAMHDQRGEASARQEVVRTLLQDGEFINRIKGVPKDDVALEIVRYAVAKNIYLGTKNLLSLLETLKRQAPDDLKDLIPVSSLPLKAYVQLLTGLAALQDYLDSREFWNTDRDLRLTALVQELARRNLSIGIDNLKQIYGALPSRLSANVGKDDIVLVNNGNGAHAAEDVAGGTAVENPGGIDFNLDLLELEIQGSGGEFELPTADDEWKDIRIEHGLLPVILNIAPIGDLPLAEAERGERQLAGVR